MLLSDINIRDPFVLNYGGKYYLYGTRACDFGRKTGGFDVYESDDLVNWSEPEECFDSAKYGLNREVNWAPEVHVFNGAFYMFSTFTADSGLRGVFVLTADNPKGPFKPHSDKALTPSDWECLDGTLYISKNGLPYLVFCHEHTQIIDGSVCYMRLSDDLKTADGDPVLLFHGSSPQWADVKPAGEHYITDGPFMYRSSKGALLLMWSTFIGGRYAQCVAVSDNSEIDGSFTHLPPLITDDGGHGMIFKAGEKLMLTFHSPNTTGLERPVFRQIEDTGYSIKLK